MENLNWRVNIRIYKDQRWVEVIWDNDPNRLVGIIGALEISKQTILKHIQIRIPWENTKPKKTMVGKNEAMKMYMDLWNTIKDRLLAIQKSNDNSQFDINPDLLSIV